MRSCGSERPPSSCHPSALVRRLLRDALREAVAPVLTVEQVEQIARRVMRETA
jgi:hypothetical protein